MCTAASLGWKDRKGFNLQCPAGWPATDCIRFDAQISARSGHGFLWWVCQSDWSIRTATCVLTNVGCARGREFRASHWGIWGKRGGTLVRVGTLNLLLDFFFCDSVSDVLLPNWLAAPEVVGNRATWLPVADLAAAIHSFGRSHFT